MVYNDVTTVKYRRMKKNATSEGQGHIKLLIWRIKNLIVKNGIKDIKKQIINYKKNYYNELNSENKEILRLFSEEKYNLFNTIKKVFYPRRLRRKLLDDLILRVIFVLGIL